MAAVPAAGWYQDPDDGSAMRWWDGDGWTEHTQSMTTVAPSAPSIESAGTDWVSNYTDDELALYTGRTSEHVAASPTVRTVLEFTGTVPDWRRDRTSAGTGTAWALACSPLLAAGALAVWLLVGLRSGIPALSLLVVFGVIALLALVFAIADARTLRARGVAAPSAWWILLGPLAYLVARAVVVRRTRASSVAPLVVHLVTAILAGIVTAVGAGTLALAFLGSAAGGPAAAGTPGDGIVGRTLAQTIQEDLLRTGQNWTVDCGGGVSVAPNASFHCQATNPADASRADVEVVVDARQRLHYRLSPTA